MKAVVSPIFRASDAARSAPVVAAAGSCDVAHRRTRVVVVASLDAPTVDVETTELYMSEEKTVER